MQSSFVPFKLIVAVFFIPSVKLLDIMQKVHSIGVGLWFILRLQLVPFFLRICYSLLLDLGFMRMLFLFIFKKGRHKYMSYLNE